MKTQRVPRTFLWLFEDLGKAYLIGENHTAKERHMLLPK